MQVIPAINMDSFDGVKKQVKKVEPYVSWVQIDVADGTFTPNTTWHNPSDLLNLHTVLNIELHLMINNIDEKLDSWFLGPVRRIIFHLETAKDPADIIKRCKKSGRQVGIAIGPDTPWEDLMPYCPLIKSEKTADLFQILAVQPGLAGQQFQEKSLLKNLLRRQ